MNSVRVSAPAKINLTLDVTGKEGDYHLIDSLAVTVDLFDRVTVKKRKDALVSVVMHGMGTETLPPEENNAQRAAEAFVRAFGTNGADVTVYKNIPVGAGLGGSSADASGVINAMAKLYGIGDGAALKELADGVGSDVGYLLTGGFARLRGRGEKVEFLGDVPPLNLLLLCPREGVSTAECYRICDTYAKNPPKTERTLEFFRSGNTDWAAKLLSNDLYPAAKRLVPETEEALNELRAFSPMGAGMTGSGSGVFALFETRELCEWAKSRYRGKCRAYVLKTKGPKGGTRSLYSVEEGG